jgi:hypothetical protein
MRLRHAAWRAQSGTAEKNRAYEKRRFADPVKRERKNMLRRKRDLRPEVKARTRVAYLKKHQETPRYTFNAILGNKRYRNELPPIDPLTVEDLMRKWFSQRGLCALSGIRMTWAPGHHGPTATSISIDRIDWALGYTDRNTRLICHCINSFRGRMSDAELLVVTRALVANLDSKQEIAA